MPEPVGSPAVLFYRVSNLPLWVGVFEVIENRKVTATRVVFGAVQTGT